MKKELLIFFSLLFFVKSFSQKTDSSHIPITVFYTYDEALLTLQPNKTDTLIHQFQEYLLFHTSFMAHLGNGITATYSLMPDFSQQEPFWLLPLQPYLLPVEHRYFDTHKPFTHIRLVSNTNRTYNEEGIKLIHTQNINAHWNIAFEGLSHKNIGRIPRQDTRFHYLNGNSYYHHHHYHLLANYTFSVLKTYETGGVSNLPFLIDSLFPAENAAVNLIGASNLYNVQHAWARQWISFGNLNDSVEKISPVWKPFFVIQSDYTRAKKIFTDNLDSISILNHDLVYDSLYYRQWLNKVGFAFAKDMIKGSGISIFGTSSSQKTYGGRSLSKQSFGTSVEAFYRTTSFSSLLLYDYWFSGFLSNNQKININLQKKVKLIQHPCFLNASLSSMQKTQDIFFNEINIKYLLNETTYPLLHVSSINAGINDSITNASIQVQISSVKNAIVFNDTLFFPRLISSTFTIFGVTIHKSFRVKNIVLDNSLMLQTCQNKEIPIPLLSGFHTLYFQQALFKKVLKFQIGASVFYHTLYESPCYNPVFGTFFYTYSNKLGNYPFVDVFMNFSLKRARFFIKVEHLNYQWQKANYCLIQDYPVEPRTFKFGIAWNFYD